MLIAGMMLLFVLILLLSSCSVPVTLPVTVAIAGEHPFEELYGRDMWYTLSYFDGKAVRTVHLGKGERETVVRVFSGGLRPFAVKPLGELGPYGGFFEPGSGETVYLTGDAGDFAEILVSAASYRPRAVERLSMKRLQEETEDLHSIDEAELLARLFDGTLNPSSVPVKERRIIVFDSIPEGFWTAERHDVPSFSVDMSGDETVFDIYPGVYRYICKERSMLLTVILTEDGEASANIKEAPAF